MTNDPDRFEQTALGVMIVGGGLALIAGVVFAVLTGNVALWTLIGIVVGYILAMLRE